MSKKVSRNFQNLSKLVWTNSIDQVYPFGEWELFDYEEFPDGSGVCDCSHTGLVTEFYIKNKYTGAVLTVGSSCVNLFPNAAVRDEILEIDAEIKRRKAKEKRLEKKALKLKEKFENNVKQYITDWNYETENLTALRLKLMKEIDKSKLMSILNSLNVLETCMRYAINRWPISAAQMYHVKKVRETYPFFFKVINTTTDEDGAERYLVTFSLPKEI